MTPSAQDHDDSVAPGHSRTERARLLAVAILSVVVTVFALVNLDRVSVDLVFGSPEMPLIVVIVACLLIGAAIGAVLARRVAKSGRD